MRYATTFNQDGQAIPPGLHIPQNFALLPYVPHPLQIMGFTPMFPVLGQQTGIAGGGRVTSQLARSNQNAR